MADEVATTSSSPPFGFSVVTTKGSYNHAGVITTKEGLSFVYFVFFVVEFGPVDGTDDGALDTELPDVLDHLQRAKAQRNPLRLHNLSHTRTRTPQTPRVALQTRSVAAA